MSEITNEQNLDLSSNNGEVVTMSSLLEEVTEEFKTKSENDDEKIEKDITLDDLDLSDLVSKVEKEVVTETAKSDKKVEETNQTESSLKNKDFINTMIKLGKWEKYDVIETDTGEINYEDAIIDDEMFKAIVEQQESVKKENLLKDRVEIKGVSDFTKKLIEIEKNGGNVTEALNVYNTIKSPLDSLDLSTERGQIESIAMLNSAKGVDDETIDTIIAGYKAQGVLDEKAEESKKILDAAYQKQLEKINDRAVEDKENRKKVLKEYTKNLRDNLDVFEINDGFKKKLVEAATKEDENSKFEIDKIYNEKRKDPKTAADLILFLLDQDEYIKQKTKEIVINEKIKTVKSFKFSKNNNDSLSHQNNRDRDKDLISMEEFTK